MKETDFTEGTFLCALYLAQPARGMTLTFSCFDASCSGFTFSGFALTAGWMLLVTVAFCCQVTLFGLLAVSALLANFQMCFQGWVRSGRGRCVCVRAGGGGWGSQLQRCSSVSMFSISGERIGKLHWCGILFIDLFSSFFFLVLWFFSNLLPPTILVNFLHQKASKSST